MRNYVAFNGFIPLTTSTGGNLHGGNNEGADGGYVSSEPYVLPEVGEIESDRVLTARALEWIKLNPIRFLKLIPAKTGRLLSPMAFGTSGAYRLPDLLARTVDFLFGVF